MTNSLYIALAAFLVGLILSAYLTHQIDNVALLELKNKQEQAVNSAQVETANKEHSAAALLQQDGVNYEKQLFAINNVDVNKLRKRTGAKHLPSSSIPSGISRPSNDRLRADTCYKEWYDMATALNK